MSELPIRHLTVSDFRRIEGTRELPLDAPVVLIHGPNGTGKTSVLSALELALTGAIRSMERQSDRYRAHLPYFGQSYATVRADVAKNFQGAGHGVPMTVNGARLEGAPAFGEAAATFYAERCYLDQTSLGRLLDLYQAREGNEQSALEKFVNELLGLEKLDALRGGLSDANDFRLIKKLAAGVDDADREAKEAATRLKENSALRSDIRKEVANARSAAGDAIEAFRPGTTEGMTDKDVLEFVRSLIDHDTTPSESAAAVALHQELIALGGRISALVDRPTTQRIQETRSALAAASADIEAWDALEGMKVQAWDMSARDAGADLRKVPRFAVDNAAKVVGHDLDSASRIRAQAESLVAKLAVDRATLDALQTQLSNAHEHSSALIESLAALRPTIEGSNVCPVCDRDFTETGKHSLLAHIDVKLADLATHGQQLVGLRNERDDLASQVARDEVQHSQLTGQLLTDDQLEAIANRHAILVRLSAQATEVDIARSNGQKLAQRKRDIEELLANLEAASSEEQYVNSEVARYASLLRIDVTPASDSFQRALAELLEQSQARLDALTRHSNQVLIAGKEASRLTAALERETAIVRRLADIAEHKKQSDDRIAEAKRRQRIGKEVFEAATQARTNIVHRVFTESLNDVWKTVFTRLAPDEGFIPSFGIPNATKRTFDIKLETTHRDGKASGPPQMMLSAGNLNTAALSLFLALHLAVEPIVPCLVFDDPVQAMDEVHVAQFAALIRLLSKQNHRQVIIAVHERELFDYLALELSPAYEGDELITIELGERATDEDEGVTRHRWAPDSAIAG